MIDNEQIQQLFKLYLEGEVSPDQQETLFRYLNTGQADEKLLFEVMHESWNNEKSFQEDSMQVDHEFADLLMKANSNEQAKKRRFQVMKYAASVLILCTIALSWYKYQISHRRPDQAIVMLSKTTLNGEKVKLILPDSTVIYLGGSSTLKWPSRFVRGHRRNITLKGEAFFEVKRDTLSPFIVHTGTMQTQVLGTSFNITAYSHDNTYGVAVRTGKVRVSENNDGIIKQLSLLTPGMELSYQPKNRRYEIGSANTNDINSWVSNRFIFKEATLQTMLKRLERYYKVKFQFRPADINGKRRFNATFDQKNIRDVMEQVRLMSGGDIHYKMTGDSLITIWEEGRK